MGQRIVVLGGSFAGLAAVTELRRLLPSAHEIVLVSESEKFLFHPSLIWVPFGERTGDDISFDLKPVLEKLGVTFVHAHISKLRLKDSVVDTSKGPQPFDLLVVASGAKPKWDAVPGLGPAANTHSIWTLDDAQRAGAAYERLLESTGPVLVGAVQGASNFSVAYEFALNLATNLQKHGPKGWRQQTFITPEPYVGHLGLGVAGATSEKIERLLLDHAIDPSAGQQVEAVEPGVAHLKGGRSIPFDFCLLAPPLRGPAFVRTAEGLADSDGFMPVDERLQSRFDDRVFAAGSVVSSPAPDGPGGLWSPPKTGYLAEVMGRIVAHNIAALIEGRPMQALPPDAHDYKLIIDAGDTGLLVSTDRIDDSPARNAWVLPGVASHWAKVAFEKYFLATRRTGLVP